MPPYLYRKNRAKKELFLKNIFRFVKNADKTTVIPHGIGSIFVLEVSTVDKISISSFGEYVIVRKL
jgi:hypothetical protein